MTRISLVEAYDDKDVITQIAKMKDKLDSIPDDADLSNCVLKVNNQIIDGRKTFNDVIVANDGIAVTGDLNVDGNIVQSGAAVEVHVEEIYTKNDYIMMREDAVTAIPPGQFSGLQIEKYDGVNNCRLVVDDQGVARVGDVNDEQPLATRDEVADMTSGALVEWDGVNEKLVTSSANVGSDSQPVKIVGGVPVAVSASLLSETSKTTGATGGVKLSNGLIMNWGETEVTIAANSGDILTLTLSIAHSSTVSYQTSVTKGSAPSDYGSIVFAGSPASANTIRIDCYNTSGSSITIKFRYLTIGF